MNDYSIDDYADVDLPPELLKALSESNDQSDPLEQADFDVVEYINDMFPDEGSLKDADARLSAVEAEISELDKEIDCGIRRHAQRVVDGDAEKALERATDGMKELHSKIESIHARAAESESLVQSVSGDVAALDVAKRHITATVTALKRLVMLVSATEQLTAFASDKRYAQCHPLVLAVVELSEMFEPLRPQLPQVDELLNHKDRLLEDLKAECLEDIEGKLFTPGYDGDNKIDVKAACETAAAIGKEVKDDVISMYCMRLLKEYQKLFSFPDGQYSTLEDCERRFGWLSRTLRKYNSEHREYFPSEWRVDKQLCLHYCHLTRQHLVDILAAATAGPEQTEDPSLLFQLAVKNIEMENDLDKRYSRGEGDVSFKGIVSNCFEPYLSIWVNHEQSLLCAQVDEAAAKEDPEIMGSKRGSVPVPSEAPPAAVDGPQTEPVFVYKSVVELFTKMKKLFKSCKSVSTSNTMFLLCVKSFRVALDRYNDKVLSSRVRASASDEQIYAVAGSCIYITQTLPLLAGSISDTIDEPLKSQINFAKQMEEAADVEAQAIEQASTRAADQCIRRITQFVKDDQKPWTAADTADVNAVTSRAHRSLTGNLREAAQGLTEPQYSSVAEGAMAKIIEDYCTLLFTGIKEPVDSTDRVEILVTLTGGLQTLLLESPVEGASAATENTSQAMQAYSAVTCRRMQLPQAVLRALSVQQSGEDSMRVEIIQTLCANREDTPTKEAIDEALHIALSMQHGGGLSGRISRDGSSSMGSVGASSGPASTREDMGPMTAGQFGSVFTTAWGNIRNQVDAARAVHGQPSGQSGRQSSETQGPVGTSTTSSSGGAGGSVALGVVDDGESGDVAAKMQQMFKNLGEQWKTKFVANTNP
ncbi:Vacuolar protein sorting-associated protein 53 [Perkinsus chesapeaki]|uniref:Vacuolar protein sorting-associated protein 53 n=1 Tax=Perkinsus chesapeaki TaxID=330153 RepID=A0A7J6M736_PERCH|nr:Vacuolar protein sorting-associated protein 53 [Perkinsus chesapeaki]